MPYYNNHKTLFLIDGIEVYMTEMEAERYQSTHPDADVMCPTHHYNVPEEEDDLECTCLPDLPDGRVNGGRGYVCPACRKFFESLLEDE